MSFVLGSPVLQGAMKHYGASDAIVYGVIPAAAPLIIVGTTVLGIAASKADWRQFGAALAVVIAGVVAAFVGPSGAWLAAGIGLFIAMVGYAAADAWRHRRVPLRRMTADALDPVIHAPARLRIVATLAALPDGASLSFTRLQDMLELTPGNLITHLRKLEDAGYLTSETTGNGRASRTSIALTRHGRAALDTYTDALRDLLGGLPAVQ